METNQPKSGRKAGSGSQKILNIFQTDESSSNTLFKLSHSVLPGFNKSLTKIDVETLKIPPNFQCAPPRNIYVSWETPNKTEICCRRTLSQMNFNRVISRNQPLFQSLEKNKKHRKLMKDEIYPLVVFRYAKLLEQNPDPYFDGKYDWYYSGGNLACTSDIVLKANGTNLNQLDLSYFIKKSLKAVPTRDLNLDDYLTSSEIFEIRAFKQFKNHFITRYKNSLLKFRYYDSELALDYSLYNSEVPFISFSEDFCEGFLATGNLNRQVLLWDINKSTTEPKSILLKQQEDILSRNDNWNCIRNLNETTYTFTDFNNFFLLDSRISSLENEINKCDFSSKSEICENIVSMELSKQFDNIVYLGTYHKLFAVDLRYISKHVKDKHILLRWTHQMEYPPLMLKTYNKDNFDLIALSSPISGDLVICENMKMIKNENDEQKVEYISPLLPVKPPTFMDSYKTARNNGECLTPYTDLEARINSCITGMDFYNQNDALFLLTANSIGDINATKIIFDEEISYTKNYIINNVNKYNKYIEKRLSKNPSSLNLTDIKELKPINKVLRCKTLSSKLPEDRGDIAGIENEIDDIELTKVKKLAKWERTPGQLAKYKDVLASGLLAVWDMHIDDTNDGLLLDTSKKEYKEDNQIEIVNNWVKESSKYYENNNFDDEQNNTEKNDVNNTLDSHDISTTNTNTNFIADQSTRQNQEDRMKRKRKRAYVKGF